MTRKIFAIGLLATTMMAAPAMASTTITGNVSGISAHTTDPGLKITASGLNFGPLTLDTAGTASATTAVLQIGSPEDVVNLIDWDHWDFAEDTTPYNIAVNFTFTDPTGVTGGPITGETFGVWQLFGNGYGHVSWGGPQTFTFGDGGEFTIALQDTDFALNNATTDVLGTFTLISDSAGAVPEPATWAMMIAGFGLVGASMRRRQKVSVTYA